MPKKTKKKEPVEEFNRWHCHECDETFDFQPFKQHLTEKHGITEMKGNRSMVMHVDGSDWFQSNYAWTIGEKQFTQSARTKRSEEDMMYWGDGE